VEGAYDIGVVDVVGIQERSSSAEDTREALLTVVSSLKSGTNTRKQLQLQSRDVLKRELWLHL
jgi:hypothetical protein